MNRVEIESKINEVENTIEKLSGKSIEIDSKINDLEKERYILRHELKKIIAEENNSISSNWFLEIYKGMNYEGKADGKTETFEGKPYAQCNKCEVLLELFEGATGIGNYVIGVCPKCRIEINFTDVGDW